MVTTKANVVGGIRPREENSNSREMRKTAQESFLAVATTWHDIGSTFSADHWRSSQIDHIVVPQRAMGLVRSCRTLPIAGRRLQPFRTRERRGHIPVAIETEVRRRCRPYAEARIRIDSTELMRCVTKGRKQEFFDGLEELANEVPEDKWEEAAQTPCSDEVWSLTRDAVRKTLQKVFPEGKKGMEEAREWRMRLLDKRRDLREQEGEEIETVQMLLKEVSSERK